MAWSGSIEAQFKPKKEIDPVLVIGLELTGKSERHASPRRWQEVTHSLYTSRAPTLCKALGTRCCRSHQDEADSPCPQGAYNLIVNAMYIYTTGEAASFSGAGVGVGVRQAKCGVILKVILFKR